MPTLDRVGSQKYSDPFPLDNFPPMPLPRSHFSMKGLPALLGAALLILGVFSSGLVRAQYVPSVQQSQFRSQWVGESVDQLAYGGLFSPFAPLGAVVGALQTPDEVQREVDASLANVAAKSPIAFKPSLGVGWQISNQGSQTTTGTNTVYGTDSSGFIAPSGAILYDRAHGPWDLSAGYSVGYRYYQNQSYVGNGTGSLRNPLSQTAFARATLEMSRYILNAMVNASAGNGYDISSGSNNQQIAASANADMKYLISSVSALAAKAGYSIQNSSGSQVTQNNNVSTFFADAEPVYHLSDKTHLSGILGVGQSYQSIESTNRVSVAATNGAQAGTVNYDTTPTSTIRYAQALGKVKYDITGKLSAEVGLGARQLWLMNSTNISVTSTMPIDGQTSANIHSSSTQNLGLKPAWSAGFNYTPTAKTSLLVTAGQLGSDVVPEFNAALNWNPREKTAVVLGLSQSQNYSSVASNQYLVSRGITGTVTQQFFSSVIFQITGGYTMQEYKSASGGSTPSGGYANQIPGSYYLLNASLTWKIRQWVNLVNTFNYNSGQTIQGNNNNALDQMWYSISLNFAL